jgi:tellurite resistance protein
VRASAYAAVAPPLFSIPLGFTGLADAWHVAGGAGAAAGAAVIALIVLIAVFGSWSILILRRPRALLDQLRDPAAGPSIVIAPIALMLLAALTGPASPVTGMLAILTAGVAVATVACWFVPRTIHLSAVHPGFFVPTVAAPLLCSQTMVGLGWEGAARTLLLLGLGGWMGTGAALSLRLWRGPKLPPGLTPTLVLTIAAPALAGNTDLVAYNSYGTSARILLAVVVVMAFVQAALLPSYRRVWFRPTFWTFGFSYATVATLLVRWLQHVRPAGSGYEITTTLLLLTALLVLLTYVSALAVARRPERPAAANGGRRRSAS